MSYCLQVLFTAVIGLQPYVKAVKVYKGSLGPTHRKRCLAALPILIPALPACPVY